MGPIKTGGIYKKWRTMKEHTKEMVNKRLFEVSAIMALWLFSCQACRNDEKRTFFTEMKPSYYNIQLDSLKLMGHFGLDSAGKNIDGHTYWHMNNQPDELMHLNGYVRFYQNAIFIRPEFLKDNKPELGPEQLLFSFNIKDINKRWFVNYSRDQHLASGDSVAFVDVKYDTNDGDTIFVYIIKRALFSLKTHEEVLKVNFPEAVVRLNKTIGFLNSSFTNGIDTIAVSFFPEFRRLDTNKFTHITL